MRRLLLVLSRTRPKAPNLPTNPGLAVRVAKWARRVGNFPEKVHRTGMISHRTFSLGLRATAHRTAKAPKFTVRELSRSCTAQSISHTTPRFGKTSSCPNRFLSDDFQSGGKEPPRGPRTTKKTLHLLKGARIDHSQRVRQRARQSAREQQ